MSSERPARASFKAHIELLQAFLAQREQIVERIQAVLNAQQKSAQQLQDRAQLSRQFEDCFFVQPGLGREQSMLRGQLQQAHWADGFRPRDMPGIPNDMFDPADMITRAFTQWRLTRWPGRNGRVRFAQTLFNLYVVRCLTLLNMRLWDEGPDAATPGTRLGQVQQLLDQLWRGAPADQPKLVRDARWLMPVAQSPTTDALAPYFTVAQKLTESLAAPDRLEVHKAAVVMAGGHLRSQLRHFLMQGRALTDHALLLDTRRSNALDCAMTIQSLVPLLDAYADAVSSGDQGRRIELAGVICQGISPDPELFVNRLDLLAAYSMIEHLFVAVDQGHARLTSMGARHVGLVREYMELIARLVGPLHADCGRFRPVPGAYSPYGVMFGFSSNLLEHMTMKALQPDADIRFSLEDVFADAGANAERLAWVSGWRQLPHISVEVQRLYEYPQQFALDIFARIERELGIGAAAGGTQASRNGKLFIDASNARAAVTPPDVAKLPVKYIVSSDAQLVATQRASACEEARLLADRNEGEFLVSYRSAGGWVGISKDVLTDVLGEGLDAAVGLPDDAASVLRLMCPALTAAI